MFFRCLLRSAEALLFIEAVIMACWSRRLYNLAKVGRCIHATSRSSSSAVRCSLLPCILKMGLWCSRFSPPCYPPERPLLMIILTPSVRTRLITLVSGPRKHGLSSVQGSSSSDTHRAGKPRTRFQLRSRSNFVFHWAHVLYQIEDRDFCWDLCFLDCRCGNRECCLLQRSVAFEVRHRCGYIVPRE